MVGFRERAAPYVADLAGCEVLAAPAGALIAPLGALFGRLAIREQLPQIEVAVADNATALVLRVLESRAADLALLREFAGGTACACICRPAGLESVRAAAAVGAPLWYRCPPSV